MALKKSEIYRSLWDSCEDLRGGMDASQYKDYVLVILFIKYVSDKYAGKKYAPITIPKGASFDDLIALKGKSDIGDQINKKIIGPLIKANNRLSSMPDFNDSSKLGTGKDMVERLSNLIANFERKELDFSKNRADGDDILGDAYEYLMRHFATQSGKSKGQFYTPSEVSRIMAQILGIRKDRVTAKTTAYDPTCGSGSLLLKVADEAGTKITLNGQEKDQATSALAQMNMYLHNNPEAIIFQGNTIADPKFKDGNKLKQFDYVVANPPFSDKRWSTGLDSDSDPYGRFESFGVPPAKQGDYAYLLHIVRSMKSTGKGACILPHGVLFRGNAEGSIRKNLITKNGCYIKGVIGLPPNLFYGTGIPACIVILDKKDAIARKGIFMIDASQGFIKDGPKNCLREQDIHKIVDVFNNQTEVAKFSRMVPLDEIQKNEYNLNLPRYIDSQVTEDRQDISAHLQGGIPKADIEALSKYWKVCPTLQKSMFKEIRPGYFSLIVEKSEIKSTIFEHKEFKTFTESMNAHFETWKNKTSKNLKKLEAGFQPKDKITKVSEDFLRHYKGPPLFDPYDIYQHLMSYWYTTMSDDFYQIATDGWTAETYRIIERDKKGKEKDKGWTCDLIPKDLVISKFFPNEQTELESAIMELESVVTQITEMEDEHGGDEGFFSEFDKVNKKSIAARLKEIAKNKESDEEADTLKSYIALCDNQSRLKKYLKEKESMLDELVYKQFPKLKEADVKTLVVDDKWMTTLDKEIHGELDRISQSLTTRIKELAERYESTHSDLVFEVSAYESKVKKHLEKMGFAWN